MAVKVANNQSMTGITALPSAISGGAWSTTYSKHFMVRTISYSQDNTPVDMYFAGYCNVTAAIDGVRFTMSSGNIDAGVVKLYGIS